MFQKSIYSLLLFLPLMGCWTEAQYYQHEQNIDLSDLREKIPNADFHSDFEITNNNISLNRFSWFDKEVVIKKEGFEDYHLKLDNVWTDETWAKDYSVGGKQGTSEPVIGLLNPIYILDIPIGIVMLPTYDNIKDWYEFTFAFPRNVVHFFGTITLNPWTKYEVETKDLILTPTEELKKSCHSKQMHFISNHGCLSCNSGVKKPISSEEECLRCSNRKWENTQCQIK